MYIHSVFFTVKKVLFSSRLCKSWSSDVNLQFMTFAFESEIKISVSVKQTF